jgi:inositol phosphorylceramide mannosyltransferase catalytic subunit
MHLLQSPKNVSSVLLILLTLFLLGTITVLGTVWKYFHVDASAVILVEELELRVPWSAEAAARRAVVESGSARIERRAGARMGVEARDEAGEVVPAFKSKYPHLASWVYSLIGSSDAGNGDAVQQGKMEEKEKPLSSEGLAGVGAGAGLKIAITTPTTSLSGNASGNETRRIAGEKIPRIIHQTWKTNTLPEKWAKVRAECQVLHPD